MGDAPAKFEVGELRVEESRPQPGLAVLALHGEADLHSASELRERLRMAIDDGATTVVLDLSETAFVDSTSLGVLLGAMKRLRKDGGGEIRLVAPRPDVRRIFEITLLDRVFPLHHTLEHALAASAADAA